MACEDIYLRGTGSKFILNLTDDGEKGTGVSGSFNTTDFYLQPFADESINANGDTFTSNAITGNRIAEDVESLSGVPTGSTTIELGSANLGLILFSALGGIHSATSTTQVFVPAFTSLPAYDAYVFHGEAEFVKKYSCMKVNSLTLDINSNSVLGASIDWVGLSETTPTFTYKGEWDASTDAYPTTPTSGDLWLVSTGGTITADSITYVAGDYAAYDGSDWYKIDVSVDTVYFPSDIDSVTIGFRYGTEALEEDSLALSDVLETVSSLSITINNNIDTGTTKLNGNGSFTNAVGMSNITGSMSFYVPIDSTDSKITHFKTMLIGLDVGNNSTNDTEIGIDYIEVGIGASASILHTIKLNNLTITNHTHDITGQGLIQYTIDFEATNKAEDIDDSTITDFPISVTEAVTSGTVQDIFIYSA